MDNRKRKRVDSDLEYSSILAYQYKITIASGDSLGVRFADRENIIEYYIPSLNICFNKHNAFHSEKPRNVGRFLLDSPHAKPMTAVQLPKSFVDKIESLLQDKENYTFSFKKLKKDKHGLSDSVWDAPFDGKDEYAPLFKFPEIPGKWKKTPMVMEVMKQGDRLPTEQTMTLNEKVPDLDIFMDVYPVKKNRVLNKAILKYIEHGLTPKNVSLNDLIDLIKKLDKIEKESIKQSIEVHFSNTKEKSESDSDDSFLSWAYENGSRLFSSMGGTQKNIQEPVDQRLKIIFEHLEDISERPKAQSV